VGIVSATGTVLQELSTHRANYGVGGSKEIDLGGHDLHDEVGGRIMHRAIEELKEDPSTDVIVAISKLPSPLLVDNVLTKLAEGDKPSTVIFFRESRSRPVIASHVLEGKMYKAACSRLHWQP
jgi:FdrA protein